MLVGGVIGFLGLCCLVCCSGCTWTDAGVVRQRTFLQRTTVELSGTTVTTDSDVAVREIARGVAAAPEWVKRAVVEGGMEGVKRSGDDGQDLPRSSRTDEKRAADAWRPADDGWRPDDGARKKLGHSQFSFGETVLMGVVLVTVWIWGKVCDFGRWVTGKERF
jgi:hypothetical protein